MSAGWPLASITVAWAASPDSRRNPRRTSSMNSSPRDSIREPVAGAQTYALDFMQDDADAQVKEWLGGGADVVMSDMAAASSGHKQTDHLRIVALCEAAAYFAFDVLSEGGTFVAKVLAGGAEGELQKLLKQRFTKVVNVKPPASRSDSSEKFVVATGFRG